MVGSCQRLVAFRSIVLFISLSFVFGDCTDSCVNHDCPCECYHTEVQCSNRSVTVIPIYPQHLNFQRLDLHNNYIANIKSQPFSQRCLKNLITLRLSSNNIKTIPANAFKGLLKVERLFLNHNYISKIKKDGFAGLKGLRRLYLNNNRLNKLHANTFSPLKKSLRLLYLHGNKIEHIPAKLLENFGNLKTLDLSGNRFTKMDGRYFSTLPMLEYVMLSNNPWSCDEATICSTFGTFSKMQEQRHLDRVTTLHGAAVAKSPGTLSVYGSMACSSPQKHLGLSGETLFQSMKCQDVNLTSYFGDIVTFGKHGVHITAVNSTDNNAKIAIQSTTVFLFCFLSFIIICY